MGLDGGTAGPGYMPASRTNARGRVVCEDCNKDYASRRTFLKYVYLIHSRFKVIIDFKTQTEM